LPPPEALAQATHGSVKISDKEIYVVLGVAAVDSALIERRVQAVTE